MKKILGIIALLLITTGISLAFNGRSFEKPIQTCAYHILVPTEEQALSIKSEITTFEEFQRAASVYSICPSKQNGGNLGCFGYGQMVKPFEQAAFSGKLGEITGPIKTQFGYHLIWVTRRY